MAPRKIERGERIEVTREQHELALKRTSFLLHMTDRSLQDLIANAWVQGVIDTTEHLMAHPEKLA